MKATELYQHLEKDFITPEMSDDWAPHMGSITDFLSENFKRRSMGLVCDFADEINKVYTAVFPSEKVIQKILDDNTQDAMLFVHHPSIWDITKAPDVFYQIDRNLLQQLKDKRISIYNLHVPLDNYGQYSTSVSLATSLDITPEKAFAPYYGALAGVFGKTDCATVDDLQIKFAAAVGHEVKLYNYGDKNIERGTVAVVAGGGLDETIVEIAENNVNVLITGITAKNAHSKSSHEFAEKHRINLLGGTHYSTEKFACIAMINYFDKLGLISEFVTDTPGMDDI